MSDLIFFAFIFKPVTDFNISGFNFLGLFRIIRNRSIHFFDLFRCSRFNCRLIFKELTVINVIAAKNCFCLFDLWSIKRIVLVIGFQNINCSVLSVLNILLSDVLAVSNQLIYQIGSLRIGEMYINIVFGMFLVGACHCNAFVRAIVHAFNAASIAASVAAPSKFITQKLCLLLSGMFLREVFLYSEFAVRKS